MLDLERIRENPGELRRMFASRHIGGDGIEELLQQDSLRRKLAAESEKKKALRNQMSRKVTAAKLEGASGEAVAVIMNAMRALGSEIAVMDVDVAELDDKINAFLLSAPNYLHASVPTGPGAQSSVEVYRRSAPRAAAREPKPYWNIGSALRILDFDGTARLRGTQFTVYRGLGAQLERAVINFFLDTYIRGGYREVAIPYTVMGDEQPDARQLPILGKAAGAGDACGEPAAGLSVVSLYRETVLNAEDLPVPHCAFSAGFRPDAPGAGRDPGGLIGRQSTKVELVKICKPELSYGELAGMTEQAQKALQALRLPCRVMLRCAGETAYCAAKTYDLEVWMPGYGRFVSVSDCSNCEDYLARRLNIRYQESAGEPPRLCHTLSGSGMVAGRTVAAILENHQNEDGTVTVPEALRKYMHADVIR
jgi:seryl-tRNA synthetase